MASPIEEIFIKLGFKVDKKPLDDTDKSVKDVISSVKKIAAATVLAIAALDRMATSLGRNNQELINFTRQTGLSIDNLNKIAGAGMLIDVNFSSEKANASSLVYPSPIKEYLNFSKSISKLIFILKILL